MQIQLITTLVFITFSFSLASDDYKNFILKGDSLLKQFNFEAAAEQYEKAYRILPDRYGVLSKLTRVYNDLGEEYYEQRN
ncbi:MAG: hypothetical protein R3250_17530, partial [Melioribacteraceae bacterium]|nr:hypothetical protein [Melioribacteraceae bacterium]